MSDTSNVGDFLRGLNITPQDIETTLKENEGVRPIRMVRLEIEPKEAFLRLLGLYHRHVLLRGCKFILDENVKMEIAQIVQEMTKSFPKQGYWFLGMYGNGKTTIAKALYDLILSECERTDFGYEARYFKSASRQISASRLIEIRLQGDHKLWDEYTYAPMLLIDDLGEDQKELLIFGNPTHPLRELLEDRYRRLNFTILSTNLTPDDLKEHYGGRVVDRFVEWFCRVIHTGSSYRRINSND